MSGSGGSAWLGCVSGTNLVRAKCPKMGWGVQGQTVKRGPRLWKRPIRESEEELRTSQAAGRGHSTVRRMRRTSMAQASGGGASGARLTARQEGPQAAMPMDQLWICPLTLWGGKRLGPCFQVHKRARMRPFLFHPSADSTT